MASAAAIFIGCCFSMRRAWLSPKNIVATMAIEPMTIASWADVAKTGCGEMPSRRSLRRCHALTPSTSIVVVITAAETTWRKELMSVLLVMTAQKLVITARLPSTLYPTGCCIQALAAKMKYAERAVATLTIQMAARWIRAETRSLPKIHIPRNVDSKKKASKASMARGAPNTLPT